MVLASLGQGTNNQAFDGIYPMETPTPQAVFLSYASPSFAEATEGRQDAAERLG